MHLPLYGRSWDESGKTTRGIRSHVSFSELRLFNECQWRWFLTKIVGDVPEDRSFHMDFGKAVHSGMEVLYEPGGSRDVERATRHALEMYDASLKTLRIDHPTDLAESLRVRDCIAGFYRDCLACPELDGIKTLKSELQLMQPIARKDDIEVLFKGFIDIVFVKRLKRKTVIYIADFKTCSWGWPAKKFQEQATIAQLLLYKHFFCKMTGADPKNVSTAFILLKKKPRDPDELTVEVAKISAGPKATEAALKYMQDAITAMNSFSYHKNYEACKRSWIDKETKEERVATCPFHGTPSCPFP